MAKNNTNLTLKETLTSYLIPKQLCSITVEPMGKEFKVILKQEVCCQELKTLTMENYMDPNLDSRTRMELWEMEMEIWVSDQTILPTVIPLETILMPRNS